MKTVRELADELGVSSRTVYRLIDSKKLSAINVGTGVKRSLRIPSDNFYLFLENNNKTKKGVRCLARSG
jgi:excisionase family DNA binding protein